MSHNRAEELNSRYLAACQLRQKPDRERIAAALRGWAGSIGVGAAAIEFVCNAEQLAAVVAASSCSERWNRIIDLCDKCAASDAWNGWTRWGDTRKAYLARGEFWTRWRATTAGDMWYDQVTSDFDVVDGWDISQLAVLAVSAACNGQTEMMLTWLGVLEAFEEGAYVIWPRTNAIYVALIPEVAVDERGRLHCEGGPAFIWLGICKRYLHGVPWEAYAMLYIIENPQYITVAGIDAEPNLKLRRHMVEHYRNREDVRGPAAFIKDAGPERLDHDERFGTLWRREMKDDEPLVFLEVISSTREANSRLKRYWLRVPPDIKSAHQAAAWTFERSPDKYLPLVET